MAKPRNQLLCVYFALLLIFMTCESGTAEQIDIAALQNVTIQDSEVSMVFYTPSTSWRASTVPCSTCLNPPSTDALGGTWHDGTHIVHSIDGDDQNGGDSNGTSSSSTAAPKATSSSSSIGPGATQPIASNPPPSSAAASTPAAIPPPASSSSSAPSASPSNGDGDGDGGDDGDQDGKQKGKGGKNQRRRDLIHFDKRDNSSNPDNNSNPFFTTGEDSDDPGFVDPPVTATINFTGSAIYLFIILPLFPALPLTTPTDMNLTFTLDGKRHGGFTHNPNSTLSSNPQYVSNFPVFSAEGLGDGEHSIVVTVGPDTVFLFDYALVTQNATNTDDGPNAPQRTSSPDGNSDSARHHDISTFVGAIGGSVGFLSILSLGLCISIKIRRRRFARRERNLSEAYAEAFTADDHGGDGNGFNDGENIEGGGVSGAPPNRRARRLRAASAQPLMAQVPVHAPFVPRYFPGSVPASPPPYVAAEVDRMIMVPDGGSLQLTASGAVTPLPPPPQFSAALATPPPMLDSCRTTAGGSYADRPPPTPPPEMEQPIAMFGERGMVTPPPLLRTPLAEETDPMLDTRRDDEDTASLRRSVRSMVSSSAVSSSDVTSSNAGTSTRHTLVSVTSASPLSTPKSMPAGQLPMSSSSPSLVSLRTTSSAVQPQTPAAEDTSKGPMPNMLGGPVSILIGRNDPSSNPSPSRIQSLPHLRQSASHASSGSGTGAEDRMSLRSFSIDDHEGVGSS